MQKIKTKVRFTSLDVTAMVANLQILVGLRTINIYDLSPSTYLFKLAKSQEKHYLLIQNGVRFHTTLTKPQTKKIPSGFAMKFRKFLRSKRIENIRQVGVERVVVITFGTQNYTNNLILQLYSQGNIILTDNNYRIVQCIRSHEFNQNFKTAVNQIYPFQYAANLYIENIDISPKNIDNFFENQKQLKQEIFDENQQKKKNKNKNKKDHNKLKDLIFKFIPCLFPLIIQHILILQEYDPQIKIIQNNKDILYKASQKCYQFLIQFMKSKCLGYLFFRDGNKNDQYFEYSPFCNKKYLNKFAYKQTKTFNQTVDQYYSKYKKSAHEQQQQFQQLVWKKYEQIKKDQDDRVQKLQQEQQNYKVKAELIERNIDDIEALIKIIKTMEDNGYSWQDIQRMISESKKNGDPLANMIHGLNILKRQIIVLLGDPNMQEQYFQLIPVQINIDYNAFTNATIYYESKKKNYQKQQRTKQASQQVLKVAEKDAMKKIDKKQEQNMIKNFIQRKMFWFQKFYWFISSQGYLIISGRDTHQNQLLVKRYMKPGDLYMHSDYGGAASTIIKLKQKTIPPRNTLEEAAVFTVCRSKAWQTKILSGAWWVYHDQVSKSAPTGQFLPAGSFMIRGKKNFIQPNRMEMGLTLLYKIDQQSLQRHLNDKKAHLEEEQNISLQIEQKIKEENDEQQFSIINLQPNVKINKQQQHLKNIHRQKQQQKQQKQQQQITEQKIIKNQIQNQSQNDSSQNQSENEEQKNDYKQKKIRNKIKQTQIQQQKKKKIIEEIQHKPKIRNKKKLKKLQKYLEEQDSDQREIIMKMIGAREMKHMKEENQQQQQQKKDPKKKKKEKKEKKKKGLQKYVTIENENIEEKQINKQKVLFLKEQIENQEQQKNRLNKNKNKKKQKQKYNNKDEFKRQKEKINKLELIQQKKKQKIIKIKQQQIQQYKIKNINIEKQIKQQQKQYNIQQQLNLKKQQELNQKQLQKIQNKQQQKKQQQLNNEEKQIKQIKLKQNNKQQNNNKQQQQQQQFELKQENLNNSSNIDEIQQQQQQQQIEQQQQQKIKNNNKIEFQQEIDEKILNSQLNELLKLVNKVYPQDNYQNFVVMCAPYLTIKENHFRIKLIPGGLKKGKTARNILHYFIQNQNYQKDKALIKSLPQQQIINSLIGNVKLVGAGLLKMEIKNKNQKKQKRKQIDRKNQKL